MTATLLFTNCRIVLPDRLLRGAVAVEGDKITSVIPAAWQPPAAEHVIDLHDAYLAPGFVDVHIHGSAGVDVGAADDAELDRMSGWLATCGVTRFVPTLVPTPLSDLEEVSTRLARWISRTLVAPPSGAIPLGLHFEGPFVSAARCGALDKGEFLRGTERDAFFDAVGADRLAGLPIRFITVAPEIEGGFDLVRDCTAREFVVSLGHTEATPEQLDRAVTAGARHMTHFMNAMPQLHHRHPGPVGWGLLDKRVSVDVIADLHHLDPLALRLVVASKTPTRVALISDAVAPAGLGDGTYQMWGEEIRVADGRTSNASGGLAGSVVTLRDAVRNMTQIGFSLVDAVRMASTVPARVLGLESLGAIAPGKVADLVAFRDELEPILTVVAGRVVHRLGIGPG